ncbi:MAG: hypothetical protein M0C28_21885 [Candidatus Moduliflexus flocculans]|nr:hypothetical protein [Candidatus Moduliflexus flocculans]
MTNDPELRIGQEPEGPGLRSPGDRRGGVPRPGGGNIVKRRGPGLFMAVLLGRSPCAFLGLDRHDGPRQKAEIARLGEGASSPSRSELVPIRFMVLERDKGVVKARVRMYDLAGSEVDLLEMTWPGTELSFDFSVVARGGPLPGLPPPDLHGHGWPPPRGPTSSRSTTGPGSPRSSRAAELRPARAERA